MPFSPNAQTVYADGPGGSPFQPPKHEVRRLWKQAEQAIDAYSSGAGSIAKQTQEQLNGDLTHGADVTAWVYDDGDHSGIYRKIGASGSGSWSLILPLPFSFIIASDVGVGMPNAIQATTSVPVFSSALVWLSVYENNTDSPVTIRFNNGPTLTIKTNSGDDVEAGGLRAGSIILGVVSGSTFRLFSDQAIANRLFQARDDAEQAATQSAAEADRAENARDQAAAYVNDIVTEKEVPITGTRNGIPALAFPTGMSDLQVLGTSAIGDAPAVHYVLAASEPSHDGKVQSADGKWWELNTDVPTASHFGARSAASAAANGLALRAAASYMAFKGLRHLRLDEDITVSGVTKADVADVVFVGKGKISGLYRKFVIPSDAGSPNFNFSGDLVAGVHLKRLNSAKAPVVAILGDSTTTHVFPDPASSQDMIYNLLKQKIKGDLAPRKPKFYNYAIGGTQLFQTMVTPVPDVVKTMGWYNGDENKTWVSYVQDVKPDLVVVNFGQNDSYGLTITMLQALVTTLRAFAKVPDIVFMTAASPSLKSGSYSDATHLDRDRAAGLIRSYAKYYGYGLIDVGRATTIARDGYDPFRTSIVQEELSYVTNPSGGNITFTGAGDRGWAISSFKMRIQIDPTSWASGAAGLLVLADDGQGAGFVSVFKTSGGLMRFTYNAGKSGASIPLWTVDTDFVIPNAPFYLWVEVNHGRFSARTTQNYWVDPIIDEMLVGYQVLRGVILWQLGTNAVVTDLRMFASLPKFSVPTITNNELYHASKFGNGNGINHMTARASTEIYAPLIEQFSYSAARQQENYRMVAVGVPASIAETVLFSRSFDAGHFFDDDVVRIQAQFATGAGTKTIRLVAVVNGVDVEMLSVSPSGGGDVIIESSLSTFGATGSGKYAAKAIAGTAVLASKRESLSLNSDTQTLRLEVRAAGTGSANSIVLDGGFVQISS